MTKSGFSLMEIIIAIALIGAVAAIIIPNLTVRSPEKERKQFILSLNNFTKLAFNHSVSSQKVCKVEFDFSKVNRKVTISESTGKKNKDKEEIFKLLEKKYINIKLIIPSHFLFKNFYIEGFDEMSKYGSGQKMTSWFYITPEGLSQSVIINFIDTKDKAMVSLELNPFSAQFKVYDSFKKP